MFSLTAELTTSTGSFHRRRSEPPPKRRRRHASMGGARITWLDAGPRDAPIIMLLAHGEERSMETAGLIEALSREYRVVVPDLHPRIGDRLAPNSPGSCERWSKLVVGLLDYLSKDRFLLFSVDLGILLSWNLLLTAGSRLSGMIVQNRGQSYSWAGAGLHGDCSDGEPLSEKITGQPDDTARQVQQASLGQICASDLPVLLVFGGHGFEEIGSARAFTPATPIIEVSIRTNDFAGARDGSTMLQVSNFLARHGNREAQPDLSL